MLLMLSQENFKLVFDKVGNTYFENIMFIFHIIGCMFIDEQPHCLRARYRERLSEGADPGSYVLSVLAADNDLDPRLKYYLTGDGAEHFNLDRDTGESCLPYYQCINSCR